MDVKISIYQSIKERRYTDSTEIVLDRYYVSCNYKGVEIIEDFM